MYISFNFEKVTLVVCVVIVARTTWEDNTPLITLTTGAIVVAHTSGMLVACHYHY
jgi:hypothetical protein